ncbi:MAG: DUF1905 domain-containing protein [Erythrobacter sp.]|uniref:DUF1905 domain-containing protein n=1 Tax=Erythrobacter sp. TaxID=1042 RepID=UPI00262EE76D|nr:DUF1905 domain-containing protein [Erythrobacter sp.]MDJ0979729.1 DUF1905 domain-containing protein [Erythrobacter sp.]
MTESVTATLPLKRWQGDRGTYHLVTFAGDAAEALATHAALHRMEFGRQRGFGSVKLTARIGDTQWRTSVFPQKQQSEWVLLVSKKVMRAEGLSADDRIEVLLSL